MPHEKIKVNYRWVNKSAIELTQSIKQASNCSLLIQEKAL